MVTPQKAQKWLSASGKNRKISNPKIKEYANSMRAGKWVLNGEGILFDMNGKLIDGQHRLSAIALSGITIPMLIIRGIDDPRAFETIDTGKKRSVSDVVGMEGIKNASLVSAIAKRLVAWNKFDDKSTFTLNSDNFTRIADYEILDYIKDNNHKIQPLLVDMLGSLPFKRCGAPSALIVSLIICNEVDEVTTMLFVDGLKTGANLSENSPIRALRERLIDPPERRGVFWETEIMAITIKAWSKFLHGKQLKTLRWSNDRADGEKFPIPGDRKWQK